MDKITDLGKIGITLGGEYDNNVIYEKLTIVLYKGKSYISTKTTQGISPEQDVLVWQLVAEAKDAYHMLVDAGKTTLTEEEFLEQLVDATKGRYIVHGNIINAADEEDLTIEHSDLLGIDVLKFKNKTYNPLTYNGMGKKILRKNIVSDVNILTQEMMSTSNTEYVIKYDYVLNENITIPKGCILKFDGGSISASGSNNTLITTDCYIAADYKVFNNVIINGNLKNDKLYLAWWHEGYFNEDCTFGIRQLSAISSFNWEDYNHTIVLINNRIKCDANVFIVNNSIVEGRHCWISNTNTEKIGVGLTIIGGNEEYNSREVKDLTILGYNIGISHEGRYVQENVACVANNIGCLFENGATYSSLLYNCSYLGNTEIGLKIHNEGIEKASNGLIIDKCRICSNGVIGLYIYGDECLIYIDKSVFEENGSQSSLRPDIQTKAGIGILCRTYNTFLSIKNSYFEAQGTYTGCAIILGGTNALINSVLPDVYQSIESINVEDVYSPNGICDVSISDSYFVETNGICSLRNGVYNLKIESIRITLKKNENQFPIYLRESSHNKNVNISDVTFYNYSGGIACSPITSNEYKWFNSNNYEKYADIKYNGVPLTTIISNEYRFFEIYKNDITKNLVVKDINKEYYIETIKFLPIDYNGEMSFTKKTVLGNGDNNACKLLFDDNSIPDFRDKVLILLGMKGSKFQYNDGSYKEEVCTNDVYVKILPNNLNNTYGIQVRETPILAILLTQDEYVQQFNAQRIELFEYITRAKNNIYESNNKIAVSIYNNEFEFDGAKINVKRNGTTAERPNGESVYVGFSYFDSTLGKPIYASIISGNTVTWVDATGAQV